MFAATETVRGSTLGSTGYLRAALDLVLTTLRSCMIIVSIIELALGSTTSIAHLFNPRRSSHTWIRANCFSITRNRTFRQGMVAVLFKILWGIQSSIALVHG